ncbi:hypothetical protein K5549_007507 [Capra hircus]|uniref:Uncharacterized protein n=1 Tax=Capra hircus TaxID=9925 RepID=A0A452G016_CAPHI|nr:hypothetical protein K5549_007507 [Capra hircus]
MNFSNRTRKALRPCLALRSQESLSALSSPSGDMCSSPHCWEVTLPHVLVWQDLSSRAVCHHGPPGKKNTSHHCG